MIYKFAILGLFFYKVRHTQNVMDEVQVTNDKDGVGREPQPVRAVVLLALELPVVIEEGLRDAPFPEEHLRDRIVAHAEVHPARRPHAQLGPASTAILCSAAPKLYMFTFFTLRTLSVIAMKVKVCVLCISCITRWGAGGSS